MKRAEFGRLGGAARLGALIAIKAAFDPKGIMNPDKLIPRPDERQAR
jgi:FAD/FMN-containing dehydrogenase